MTLAKKEGNSKELLDAYDFASGTATDSSGLKYGDSILTLAIKLHDQVAIGSSYFTIANGSIMIYDYKRAIEFSITSYDYFRNQNSDELSRKSLFTIGKLRLIIGEDEEAKKLLKNQYLYFKKHQINNDSKLWYSTFLTAMILTNAKLKEHKENDLLIKEAYSFYSKNRDFNFYKFHIYFSDAYNDFSMGKYSSAIIKINNALDIMHKINYRVPENVSFLLAQCYWKSGETEKAFPIFKQIRDNYFKNRKTSPSFRPAFDFFTEYYKKHGTTEQQLASMNDLLEFDKYEREIHKYIQTKLKEFDEKYKIEEDEESNTLSEIMSYVIICLSSLAIIYYVFKKVKSNKTREQNNISNTQNFSEEKIDEETQRPKTTEVFAQEEIDYDIYRPINKLTVEQILKAMNSFESSFGFLEQDLKLTSLAQKLNTNDKYLSKIIKIKTGKTFNAYLTDLRFKYLDEKLKTDSQFKNQKIKDISSNLGFGSPEFFATAFKEEYGKSPKEYFES
ncbi:helix-turn-helix transcriptional regulator [Chryseobacterium wangxinyae]|uniref:helix-turn-helix domain-containing protein n=1 Tax=Chryseobacterium sp. CY350 TaxID=2997336 RepID=UPI0022FD5B1C|nr:response regulator transcription factor [Chryseobacterium sp. CY350]WBZ95859.1 helix-turn-helix transcriptional regulator [Chryseobacterium sp. CY350]